MALAQYSDLPDEPVLIFYLSYIIETSKGFAFLSGRNYNISSEALDVHLARKALYREVSDEHPRTNPNLLTKLLYNPTMNGASKRSSSQRIAKL